MSSGSNTEAASTPAAVCMPLSSMASPARARPLRPIGVRVAATMTASLAWVMGTSSSGPHEDGDRELVGDGLERDLQGHAHLQFVEGAVDDVRHHARPLGQVDDGGDVGHPVPEGGHVVVVDDRPGVEGPGPAGLVPLHLLAPARRAEGPRIVGVGLAGEAVPDEEAVLFCRLPELQGVALRRGEVETDRSYYPLPWSGPGGRGPGQSKL